MTFTYQVFSGNSHSTWRARALAVSWASSTCDQPKGPFRQRFRIVLGWLPTAVPLEGPAEVSQACSWQGSPEFSPPWSGQTVWPRGGFAGASVPLGPHSEVSSLLCHDLPLGRQLQGFSHHAERSEVSFPQGTLLNNMLSGRDPITGRVSKACLAHQSLCEGSSLPESRE